MRAQLRVAVVEDNRLYRSHTEFLEILAEFELSRTLGRKFENAESASAPGGFRLFVKDR